jgi:hypothetical protein
MSVNSACGPFLPRRPSAFVSVIRGLAAAVGRWPSRQLMAHLGRPGRVTARLLSGVFLPRRPLTSIPYRETALAQVLATWWHTTMRESEPRCDGRCA